MIVIEAIFEASPDKIKDFVSLALQTMAASRLEKGCLLYRFTADLEHPNSFTLIELWETHEDLKAHFRGNAFKRFSAELPRKGRTASYLAWEGSLLPFAPSQL
jgi:quinol monooxygenase YgiN